MATIPSLSIAQCDVISGGGKSNFSICTFLGDNVLKVKRKDDRSSISETGV